MRNAASLSSASKNRLHRRLRCVKSDGPRKEGDPKALPFPLPVQTETNKHTQYAILNRSPDILAGLVGEERS